MPRALPDETVHGTDSGTGSEQPRRIRLEPLVRQGELFPEKAEVELGELEAALQDALLLAEPADDVGTAFFAFRELARALRARAVRLRTGPPSRRSEPTPL